MNSVSNSSSPNIDFFSSLSIRDIDLYSNDNKAETASFPDERPTSVRTAPLIPTTTQELSHEEITACMISNSKLGKPFITRLWDEKQIEVLKTKELVFSTIMSEYLNYKRLREIFRKSPQENFEEVTTVDFRKYTLLGPEAPVLFVKYCPKLQEFKIENNRFYDHKILYNNEFFYINKRLLAHASSFFKGLIEKSDREESSFTILDKKFTINLPDYIRAVHRLKTLRIDPNDDLKFLLKSLFDIETLGCSYFQNETENRIEELLFNNKKEALQLKKDPDKNCFSLTFDKLYARFLTDFRLESLLKKMAKNDQQSVSTVDLQSCIKLTPQAVNLCITYLPNLEPSCFKRFLSTPRLCDHEFTLKDKKIIAHKKLLIGKAGAVEKLFELDLSKVDPQILEDFIDYTLGYEVEKIPVARFIALYAFIEENTLVLNDTMKNRFLYDAAAFIKKGPQFTKELHDIINTIYL
jgi:hypothetical protein